MQVRSIHSKIPDNKFAAPDLTKDRFFDPTRVPKSVNAWSVIRTVTISLAEYEMAYRLRRRRRKSKDLDTFLATVTAIISDVVHAVLSEDPRQMVVPFDTSYLGKADSNKHPSLNTTLPTIVKRLAEPELGWLVYTKGKKGLFGSGQRTSVRAGARLISLIERYELELTDFGRTKSKDILILKAPKEEQKRSAKLIKFEETDLTRTIRSRLIAINDWIAEADLRFDGLCLEKHREIDTDERTLRRTFNRGCFESGGRLSGGFWIDLKKKERLEGLWINGERIVSLDYGQVAPRILYGMEGKQPPREDLYELPGVNPAYRDGIKKTLNSLTFKDSLPARLIAGTKKLLPRDMSIGELVRLLKGSHPDIAHHFGTQIGHYVQYCESEILIEAMLRLKGQGVVALPVHDCLLVPGSSEVIATSIMKDVFKDLTGVDTTVGSDRYVSCVGYVQ